MTRTRALALAMTIAPLAWACTSTSPAADGGDCPSNLPTCPTPPPSYSSAVAPIVGQRCLPCHGDGGVEVATHDLRTYDAVFAQRSAVLNQVFACTMPPADAGAFPPGERQLLLTWLVCHAPNN